MLLKMFRRMLEKMRKAMCVWLRLVEQCFSEFLDGFKAAVKYVGDTAVFEALDKRIIWRTRLK